MYPKKFEDLVNCFSMLPGVGIKTAERYAFQVLQWNEEQIEDWYESFNAIKDGIPRCSICGNLSEGDICDICSDDERDHNTIVVVEGAKDVIAFEKTGQYQGVYHILNGVINSAKGIYPEDLRIDSLEERINNDTKEVILALNSTVEGETTSLYIKKILEDNKVQVTRLASGIPIGGHLDYADEMTLIKSLEGRSKME